MTRPGFRDYRAPYTSILVIKSNGVSDFRVTLAARHLEAAGYHVEIISQVPYYSASQHDIFLCSRPGEDMCKFLELCLRIGKKVIVDMDDDFYNISPKNSAYNYVGAGHPTYHITLKRLLPKVSLTYSSPELIDRYKLPGLVIPNCFDEDNELWHGTKFKSDKVRLGFTGTATHREDFRIISKSLHWILKERKDIKLVIGVDDVIYSEFSDVPLDQKLFLPPMPYNLYPASFLYFDILLAPLLNTVFNRAKSDIKLVEAGISKTPWLASSLPAYEQWGLGGKCVEPGGDWTKEILNLVDDKDLAKKYAEAGYLKAQERTSAKVAELWLNLIGGLINE